MKRGVSKQVSITRSVTYSFTRTDLIKRLRLPDDAVLEADGEALDDELLTLKVHVIESITRRAPKVAA